MQDAPLLPRLTKLIPRPVVRIRRGNHHALFQEYSLTHAKSGLASFGERRHIIERRRPRGLIVGKIVDIFRPPASHEALPPLLLLPFWRMPRAFLTGRVSQHNAQPVVGAVRLGRKHGPAPLPHPHHMEQIIKPAPYRRRALP